MADGPLVFCLPDVGEGLTEAEILTWHVRPGDVVAVNQVIVEIETAKASVELPCPFAGTVSELHAPAGAVIPVGAPLITISAPAAAAGESPPRQAVLVGYGVRADGPAARRARRADPVPAAADEAGTAGGEAAGTAEPGGESHEAPKRVRAKPLVRRLARERGVDLTSIAPTGPAGEVTRRDVLAAAGDESACRP